MISAWISGLILACGLGLRLHKYNTRDFWTDELAQLRSLQGSLENLLVNYLPSIPGGFPGEYLLIWPIAQISQNKWVLTAPHLLLTLIGLFLFFRISWKEIGPGIGLVVAALIFAFNRNLIFHALEIRPYAVLPTLALALFAYTDRLWDSEPSRWRPWGWGLLLFIVLLFHAYGVLMAACCIGFHALMRARERGFAAAIQVCWKPTLAAGLLALPLWWYFATARGLNPGQWTRRRGLTLSEKLESQKGQSLS